MSNLRLVQFFDYVTSGSQRHRFQNYFVGQDKTYNSNSYAFAPFQSSGSLSTLTGDNETVTILFPATEYAIRLVDGAGGNRQSELTLTTMWLTAEDKTTDLVFAEQLVGIGSSFDDTTLELRFRTAMDSVGANFPTRTFTKENAGILPINAELSLR